MRDLVAHKVLPWADLVERREQGIIMDKDGTTEDLAYLALQDALSKLSATEEARDKAEEEVRGWIRRVADAEAREKATLLRLEQALKERDERVDELSEQDGKIDALESRLDAAQKAFRAADDSKHNDWCDATKESWPVKSSAWLDLEDALFAGVVEKHDPYCVHGKLIGREICGECQMKALSE